MPRFIDEDTIQQALDAAASTALQVMQGTIPALDPADPNAHRIVRAALAQLLQTFTPDGQHPLVLGDDAFGDPFDVHTLPLARPGTGYAVQWLDTDTILDRERSIFLPVRDHSLQGIFPRFDDAYAGARRWLSSHAHQGTPHAMAIVPAYFDADLERHVLIYGVLTRIP